jgi:hypothetical protein
MLRQYLVIVVMGLMLLTTGSIMALAADGASSFTVTEPIFVGTTELQPGAYDVKWEATSAEATVIFELKGKEVAKVKAKFVELEQKNDRNSLMKGKDSAGHLALKQIQFAGKKARITFFE